MEQATSQGMQGSLVVVSAPSGGGKTSLTRALLPWLARRGISAEISVSYTTRAPRAGEIPGEHYHFVTPDDFAERVDSGGFLEHAEVFGRRYGTARDVTEARCAAGVDVILDIDWQGLRQVRLHRDDVASVFILPPSVEVLAERLRGRGQDSEHVIADRMAAARAEMRHFDEYEHVIINDDFNVALEALGAIFLARRHRQRQQAGQHAELIRRLLG
nr:guanylate kinase [Polycyclovorans algicola]